jgi:hypothetical protein
VIRILRDHGCFPADSNIKSRHWANIVLKQAGIEKKF